MTITTGEGLYAVTLTVHSTRGQGLCCFLTGGTHPHVGGTVLASPGVILHGQQLSSCDLWSVTVPGHKDAEAAALVAKRLCVALGQPVSVCAGIHVDYATEEEIRLLCRNCLEAAQLCIQQICGSCKEAASHV